MYIIYYYWVTFAHWVAFAHQRPGTYAVAVRAEDVRCCGLTRRTCCGTGRSWRAPGRCGARRRRPAAAAPHTRATPPPLPPAPVRHARARLARAPSSFCSRAARARPRTAGG
eukprot:3402236-Rhodomonas_salina.1